MNAFSDQSWGITLCSNKSNGRANALATIDSFANLPARFSDQTHYIYICICGYAEAVPAAGGAPLALDADFKPQADADGIVTHLHLVRAHEIN
jgi:hypothetical protein